VFVTACAIGAVILFIRRPRLGFLAVWFFITLAPTSSFAPIAAEVGADRRMYVPLIGLIVLLVLTVRLLLERVAQPPATRSIRATRHASSRVAIASAMLVIVVSGALGMRTVARNRDYADELRLSQTTLEAWPSGVAHSMVGLSLAKLNRHDEAARELRQAVVDYAPAGYDLGAQLFLLGQLDEAAAVLQRFVQAEPGMFTTNTAHTVLGRIRLSQHREAEAASEFALALAGSMPDPQAHALLAELLLDQQQYAAAIDHYRAYLQTAPSDAQGFGNLGIALASANRPVEAVVAFRRAAELQPGNASAHENLARMLVETGDAAGAAAAAQQALALTPASAAAHDLLGQALVAQRRIPEAREHFLRALQIDPSFPDAREHLRRIGG
jgi:tetratricopeptide (TPR) repeat protein